MTLARFNVIVMIWSLQNTELNRILLMSRTIDGSIFFCVAEYTVISVYLL